MKYEPPVPERSVRTETSESDLVVVGGGMAGVCTAITAARAGLSVTLIQDRPVLGGNASSEVRLWMLGATSHMGNNNRWAREGGVVDEILVDNTWRNPEGNPYLLDAILLDKTCDEPNIQLLLNTAVYDIEKHDPETIASVTAWCPQNETRYTLRAPLFCDASGDGIVGFIAGAAFRMGAEKAEEFGEAFAPDPEYGELLGHSIYFYSRDTGRPVTFVPPSFALKDITAIPRYRDLKTSDYGCRLWWFEYGGVLDTVHDTEAIKWELWRIVYGVWNHIKNSGEYPDAENLTLEWVGTIPGKRESRRFEGDVMLIQQDIVEQRHHADAVSYGGWAMDVHPAEGVYSRKPGCTQWHSKGVYQIPYSCLYSRNIKNLFLGGRLISASHVAFASTRVMATCAHNGQAVGIAAALCRRHGLLPSDLNDLARMTELQRELIRTGQYIPGVALEDSDDLAATAGITASSTFVLDELLSSGDVCPLNDSAAMLIPLLPGRAPAMTFRAHIGRPTRLTAQLRISSKPDNFTPDVILSVLDLDLVAGTDVPVNLQFEVEIDRPRYVFVCFLANPDISLYLSDERVTGVMSLFHRQNGRVAKGNTQMPPPGIGVESFELWIPERRPGGSNFAMRLEPAPDVFGAQNVINGWSRPTRQPNAWVARRDDPAPELKLEWNLPQTISEVVLGFDTDFDHAMESVLMGHPERTMPACCPAFQVVDDTGHIVAEEQANHQTRRRIVFSAPIVTCSLTIHFSKSQTLWPTAVFEVRCYAQPTQPLTALLKR